MRLFAFSLSHFPTEHVRGKMQDFRAVTYFHTHHSCYIAFGGKINRRFNGVIGLRGKHFELNLEQN
jgi:hypothetical protein